MNKKQQQQYLIEQQADLQIAQRKGDKKQIALAMASLGNALFVSRKYTEGLAHFDRAIKLAKDLDDPLLQAQCLGLKTLACQNAERLPEAFKAAQEVEKIADENQDLGMKCDALASRAQILLDSGDEIGSLTMFNESLDIARNIGDKRREMNLLGALGNYSLKIASMDRGEAYFKDAVALAKEVGERESEIGYLGNLASIFAWTERYEPAEAMFLEVLAHLRSRENHAAEVQVIRHLINVYEKQNRHEKVIEFADQGIPLAEIFDEDLLMAFSESLITAHYKLGNTHEAHEATKQTIAFAGSTGKKDKEASFLLSLGESYLVSDQLVKALEIYLTALKALKRRSRLVDVAHVTGRIGIVLAEMGRVDEAIPYHQEAVTLAEKNNLSTLEGEQLTMLGMALHEKGEVAQAKVVWETAVSVFTQAGLTDQVAKVKNLLAELE